MSEVTRLETFVGLRDDDSHAWRMSLSARLEAILGDGRHVVLLDDRGWVASNLRGGLAPPTGGDSSTDAPDIWKRTSVREIEETARSVVGPDEPFGGQSQHDVRLAHWAYLAELLRRHGVIADARDLGQLPHDVVLDERLLARLRHGGGHLST